MSQTIAFPNSLKLHLQRAANQRNYPVIKEILQRGSGEELVVNSLEEAQALVNVARLQMLDASLQYPFWDEDSPKYDRSHESAFQDVQMGIFEKTVLYVGQAFKIVSTV